MDLSQTKLSKIEWNMIEVPVSEEEKTILQLIIDGYDNMSIRRNNTDSMLSFTKIQYTEDIEKTIYRLFFDKNIQDFVKKFIKPPSAILDKVAQLSSAVSVSATGGGKIKRADSIRIDLITENIMSNRERIFEFIQVEFAKKIIKYFYGKNEADRKKSVFYLYTLIQTNRSQIPQKNKYVQEFCAAVINSVQFMGNEFLFMHIIKHSQDFIEKNKYIIQYSDLELYSHQKQIFSIFRGGGSAPAPSRLVLYLAPTGTGKTMTPLGLSQGYRIIFVCVARHVGLALAKSAISMGKRIAFAFGCETAGDIRLHYFAAKDYVKNARSGMIQKVDNTVGDKVEIMICDIKSYLCAMNYMIAFNPIENIVTYWDEPTITMDVEAHELHDTIHRNWVENRIPNIVLSCATLPRENEIMETIQDFRERFPNAEIHTVTSYETKKSVSLVNKNGYTVTPHNLYPLYEDIVKCARHCSNTKSLLKYFDLSEISRFIVYITENGLFKHARYSIYEYFTDLESINMNNIKLYYLKLLTNIKSENWTQIYNYMENTRTKKIVSAPVETGTIHKVNSIGGGFAAATASGKDLHRLNSVQFPLAAAAPPSQTDGVFLTTKDAHTLTDGPTIYLAEDVNKIARFYLQQSNIPESILARIHASIEYNNKLNTTIQKLQQDMEDINSKDAEKDNKMSQEHRIPPNVKKLMEDIENIRRRIKSISLDTMYVPNSHAHQTKWVGNIIPNAFTSDIDEQIVEEIANLRNVANSWKILLLMGIGVFIQHENSTYMEIMKKLAYSQKLYMIIASSDFIYGTNYQFCHGVLGKDLMAITPQKTIQAIGRIGRNNIQQNYTVRFRDDELLHKLFQENDQENLEAVNMCKLFCSTEVSP